MDAENWKRRGEFIDIEEMRIFYVRKGDAGDVLLCLHGFPTSSFDYHKIWPGLAPKFKLIAFDMVGYGFSSKPRDFAYTTFKQVDVLQQFIRHMGVSELHVLSHDYGNTIVQELLAREREGRLDFEIKTICFMNGALFPETHRPILAQKLLIGPIGPIFGRLIPDNMFKQSLASVFGANTRPTEEEMDDFLKIFQFNDGRKISHKLIQYMKERETYRERWVGSLQKMSQPFRFINGLDDPVSGRHLVKRFRQLLPDQKDIVELEGIGHFPHFEIPDAVIDHYLGFREKILQKS